MKLAHFVCIIGVGLFLVFYAAPIYATDFSMKCDAEACKPDSIARFFDEDTLWYPTYGKSNTVTIKNTSETSQYIGHRAFNIRTSSTADLSKALDLTIVRKSVNKVVWKSTLREFYDSHEAVLAVLGSGKTDSFEYTIVMNRDAGNEYQGATTQFDLLFGFFMPTVTPTPTPTPTPTSTPTPTHTPPPAQPTSAPEKQTTPTPQAVLTPTNGVPTRTPELSESPNEVLGVSDRVITPPMKRVLGLGSVQFGTASQPSDRNSADSTSLKKMTLPLLLLLCVWYIWYLFVATRKGRKKSEQSRQ
ncbi:hypothetical protein KBD81_01500 [Candidatus Woesebacteria bacterium]|nr:hypothetical protein [Candidatus Woesebacteria bacterium]